MDSAANSALAISKTIIFDTLCKTAPLARVEEDEGPVAVQIFGSDPAIMAEAARMIEEGFAGGVAPIAIDINMGCPVHKIVANREGSALMKEPLLVERIVSAVHNAVSLPVSVKIRAGWDDDHRNAPEIARACEEGGASLLTVHGRTRVQMYAGEADYGIIEEVVRAVSLPVVGNGDVRDIDKCRRLFEIGCRGVMVARGAVGDPFVFSRLRAALAGEFYHEPTLQEKLVVAGEQVRIAAADKGETVAVRESRKQLAAYLHGRRGASSLRLAINQAQTLDEIDALLARARELSEQS